MDDIVAANGGYRPMDLDVQVRKRMKPEVDRLRIEGEKLYKEQEAREAKQGQTLERVEPGTTLTHEKATALLKRSGGDKDRARKLAEELGYKF